VSTQRQTAIKLLPPSDYKLPLGEQAVRTEPSRMGGDSSIDFAFLFIMVYKMVYMVNYLKLTLN
jgi:hypothetical protein